MVIAARLRPRRKRPNRQPVVRTVTLAQRRNPTGMAATPKVAIPGSAGKGAFRVGLSSRRRREPWLTAVVGTLLHKVAGLLPSPADLPRRRVLAVDFLVAAWAGVNPGRRMRAVPLPVPPRSGNSHRVRTVSRDRVTERPMKPV